MNEQELLELMAEHIEARSGVVIGVEDIKNLLIEVQREQLKGLVYQAFLAVAKLGATDAQTPSTYDTDEAARGLAHGINHEGA